MKGENFFFNGNEFSPIEDIQWIKEYCRATKKSVKLSREFENLFVKRSNAKDCEARNYMHIAFKNRTIQDQESLEELAASIKEHEKDALLSHRLENLRDSLIIYQKIQIAYYTPIWRWIMSRRTWNL
jgi:hypothetical protein